MDELTASADPSLERAPSFTEIAQFYDELMKDVPYALWTRHVFFLASHFGRNPGRVLDLACGTGTVSLMLAAQGCEVIGIDGSPQMLSVARRKAAEAGAAVKFELGDLRSFQTSGRFDLVLCLYDSLNNLLEPEDLAHCFSRIRRSMQPDGLFIFDVNTEYAFRANLFTQQSFDPGAMVQYRWRSRYDYSKRLCSVEMDFWVKEGDSRKHYAELHLQRPYSQADLSQLLDRADLQIIGAFDGLSLRPPDRRTDRLYVVAAIKPAMDPTESHAQVRVSGATDRRRTLSEQPGSEEEVL